MYPKRTKKLYRRIREKKQVDTKKEILKAFQSISNYKDYTEIHDAIDKMSTQKGKLHLLDKIFLQST